MDEYNENGNKVDADASHLSDEEVTILIAMWAAGAKQSEIADKLNRAEKSISNSCRRLARKGLITPRSVTLPDAIKAQVKELWNAGVRRSTIAERVGLTEVAVFSLLRRMASKGEVEVAPVPREDMPPTRLPLAKVAADEARHMAAARHGGSKTGQRTSHQAIVRALPLPPYVGQSGVVVPPWPADVDGKPLLGGIGHMPEPPVGHGLCSWITSPSDGSVGWRQTTWCCEKVDAGSNYCAAHHGKAMVTDQQIRDRAPINTTMTARFGR